MRAVAAAAVVLTGCFYIDPITTRPHALVHFMKDGKPLDGNPPRKSKISAMGSLDTERPGTFNWHVVACTGTGNSDCDEVEFDSSTKEQFDFEVPIERRNRQLVTVLRLRLDAYDDRGVFANNTSDINVADGMPTIELDVAEQRYAVGMPIHVFARYGDPEFEHEHVDLGTAIRWELTPAATPPTRFEDFELPPPAIPDPTHVVVGKRLVPMQLGTHVLTAQASDPTCDANPNRCNRSEPAQRTFEVGPDQPPCLVQWQPIAPPAGQTLPVGEPTAFQVPLVSDELDAFPRTSSELEFGTTTFAWSLLRPGAAARETIAGAVGNQIVFDPGVYTPGDIVELRVEVTDRHQTMPTCADGEPTCAMTPDASCLQRQTWRIEVR